MPHLYPKVNTAAILIRKLSRKNVEQESRPCYSFSDAGTELSPLEKLYRSMFHLRNVGVAWYFWYLAKETCTTKIHCLDSMHSVHRPFLRD